ncbi:MAG: MlaD family protein [Candidatus Gastranaerophilaceae bacterium]
MNNLYKSLIVVFLLLFIGAAYYNYRTNTYVTAEFKNLRPFHDRAPIYYNGFKIGKVVKVRPNADYTSTILTLELHPDKLRLPINIVANLKKERNKRNDKFDYIDIIYPEAPSIFFIKDGDRIAGKTTVELDTYLSNQDPESLDAIKKILPKPLKT